MARVDGRGWAAVFGLAVVTAALSVVHPALLIFVPLGVMLVALPPRRPAAVALAVVIGLVCFTSERGGSLWYIERGWALILSAWFIIAVLVLPRARFLPRGLLAVFATASSVALVLLVRGRAFVDLDSLMTRRLRGSAADVLQAWRGSLGRFEQRVADTVYRAADLQAMLFPALLALASLSALAVAWWAYRRVTALEGQPLAPLREFRFNDGLVWLLIAGMVLLVLPLNELASRAGSNLLVFMAALYALRGAAVLLVLGGAPGPMGLLLVAVLMVFLYPLVVAATFFVGLTDTWIDIRTRRAAPNDPAP